VIAGVASFYRAATSGSMSGRPWGVSAIGWERMFPGQQNTFEAAPVFLKC